MSAAIATFFHFSNQIDRVLTSNLRIALAAQRLEQNVGRQESAMSFMLAGRPREARDEFEASWPSLNEAYDQLSTTSDSRMKLLGGQLRRYRAAAVDMLYITIPANRNEATTRYLASIRPPLSKLATMSRDIFNENRGEIVRANEKIKRQAGAAAVWSIAITGIALVVAIALAFVIVRIALRPLAKLASQAEQIGSGDLSGRIDLKRSDEIGALATSFNQMAENLSILRAKEEKRLYRAEMMADAALEFMYDPVLITDAQGRIVYLNRAAIGLWGPSPIAPRTPIVEHIGDRRIVRAIQNAVTEGRVSASEDEATLVPIRTGDFDRFYRLRATPMRFEDGSVIGCVAVLEDITHVKELDRIKNEFIGVASHELRTPVTSLLLSVQLLEEGAAGPLTEGQKQVIQTQKEDLERLERLMRELLDISRLESGANPPRFEMTSVHGLVTQAYNAVKAKAASKGVELMLEEQPDLPDVRADAGQISRVLVNLADNAVRHTPPGGSVTIGASQTGNHVRFRVADTGAGIPREYLNRIFDRFVQVPGATQGGAGLGLSIAQTIVKAHGGEMNVESELGKGATFCFDLGIGHAGESLH